VAASHLAGPALVSPPPGPLYRVARCSGPLEPSRIAAEDALQPRAGNRFDVPGGGVVYCGTSVRACFAETLARFRPTAKMRSLMKHQDREFVVCGGVPSDWREQRTIVTANLMDPLPFVDVDDPVTHEYLTTVMADELAGFGVDVLDVDTVRGKNRLLTRAMSSWAYWAATDDGPKYSGIRYMSRVIPDQECWAVFEGTEIVEVSRRAIEINDPDLMEIAAMWGLRIF
jgi:hypothetical protein